MSARAPDPKRNPAVPSKTILITGSTDGLGRGVALSGAAAGHSVIIHGRSPERVATTIDDIERETGNRPRGVIGDFASLADVASVAAQVRELTDSLDVLVSNAGIGTGYPEGRERSESVDELELRWAVNYLAPFVLVRGLLPLLEAGTDPRVVLVASDGQAAIDFDNVMLERDYSGEQAYCQSKLALVAFGFDLAESEPNIVTVSMHPGSFMATKIVVTDGRDVVDDLQGGIDAVIALALAPEFAAASGTYFERTTPARALDPAYDAQMRKRLRELSEQQVADSVIGK